MILKEYVITLKNKEDLDNFYHDMETPGGNLYIPSRAVESSAKRKISRSTHYLLTEREAQELAQDSRVLSVELSLQERGVVARPCYVQYSDHWDTSGFQSSDDKNWGLLRMFEGYRRPEWIFNSSASGTVNIPNAGLGVDIVIVDGHIDPGHCEFTVNSDGTGASRIRQIDWFKYADVDPGVSGQAYSYGPYVVAGNTDATADNNHGCHVAGITAGNTQGWARSALIYNINPYPTNPNPMSTNFVVDYIRAWHAEKRSQGINRPTIVNNSWAFVYEIDITQVDRVVYRGTTYNNPDESILEMCGLYVRTRQPSGEKFISVPLTDTGISADIQDAIQEGIVFVGAAGNEYTKMDVPGGTDYNNYLVSGGYSLFYHRGSSPGRSHPNAIFPSITVGAMDAIVPEIRRNFSNTGPGVTIWAPGTQIQSSTHNQGAVDPRNSAFRMAKMSGSSMAAPQITGMLACAMEVYPGCDQNDWITYLDSVSEKDALQDPATGDYMNFRELLGSANQVGKFKLERQTKDQILPKKNHWNRLSQGVCYPRPHLRHRS